MKCLLSWKNNLLFNYLNYSIYHVVRYLIDLCKQIPVFDFQTLQFGSQLGLKRRQNNQPK